MNKAYYIMQIPLSLVLMALGTLWITNGKYILGILEIIMALGLLITAIINIRND